MSFCLLCSVAVSGGTPSEAGSSYYRSPGRKVTDWLKWRHPDTIESSSGVDTMSEADMLTAADEMSVRDADWS